MKKTFLIIGIVLLSLIGIIGGIILIRKNFKKEFSQANTPALQSPKTEELPLEMLPVVRLIPRADKHEVTLEIKDIQNADVVEYELTYSSNGLTRGVVGTINLNGETSFTRKILLGTCSRDVCKYDENITDGMVTLRLRGNGGLIKIVAPFDLNASDHTLKVQGWRML